jgi:hypothetical protein
MWLTLLVLSWCPRQTRSEHQVSITIRIESEKDKTSIKRDLGSKQDIRTEEEKEKIEKLDLFATRSPGRKGCLNST